jgi:serine phosphatase RsbU (regulator of sigma subunit)
MNAKEQINNNRQTIARPFLSGAGVPVTSGGTDGRGPRITPLLSGEDRHRDGGCTELAILSTIAADIFELADAKWLVAAKEAGNRMTPVCIFGRPPALSETLELAEKILRREGANWYSTAHEIYSAAEALIRPLRTRGAMRGAIILGPKRGGGEYSPEARELIALASDHMGQLLDSPAFGARVATNLLVLERTRSEIAAARQIQSHLLTSRDTHIPGLDCYGQSRPAGEVGGDFFDFIHLAGGELGLAIGDVTEKGIPAAIVMAGLQMSVRALAWDSRSPIPRQMTQLNALLFDVLSLESYATMYYAAVDPVTRRLTYVNAGHTPPLLIRRKSGMIERLDAGGPGLGLLGFACYGSRTVMLDPGDVLICFTDGVPETCDAGGTEMTVAGIVRVALEHLNQPAHEMVEAILRASDDFSQGRAPRDDRTVVVLRAADPAMQTRTAAACSAVRPAVPVVRESCEMIS